MPATRHDSRRLFFSAARRSGNHSADLTPSLQPSGQPAQSSSRCHRGAPSPRASHDDSDPVSSRTLASSRHVVCESNVPSCIHRPRCSPSFAGNHQRKSSPSRRRAATSVWNVFLSPYGLYGPIGVKKEVALHLSHFVTSLDCIAARLLSCSAALSGHSPEAACGAPKARGWTASAQTESQYRCRGVQTISIL
jgi:hypothetical protein